MACEVEIIAFEVVSISSGVIMKFSVRYLRRSAGARLHSEAVPAYSGKSYLWFFRISQDHRKKV